MRFNNLYDYFNWCSIKHSNLLILIWSIFYVGEFSYKTSVEHS